jgi:hypothetical protein
MTSKRHAWIGGLLAPAILLLATLGFFWRILFTLDAWKPGGGGDLVSFLFPVYRFAAASLRAGDLPLWQPHLYSGTPFLADMQTGLFYPINLLLFLLVPSFPYEAMEWIAILHVYLAGLFMYLCLRYLEPGRPMVIPAALAGAITYMFCDMFVVHFGNLNLIAVAAWLPLVFLLFWRALRTRRLSWAAGAGVILGTSTLEGHLQITLYIGLTLAVVAAVEALTAYYERNRQPTSRRKESRRHWAWPLLALIVTASVAMAISAMVLLPAIEYTSLSPRADLPYRQAARFSLVPGLLGEMLVPSLFNTREPGVYWGVWDRIAVGYVGIFPLVLAGLTVLLWRGRLIRLFTILAGVAFLIALGGESVVHGWVYWLLPGFGQLRAPARTILILDFALAALAAIGLAHLLRAMDRQTRRTFNRVWRGLVWLTGGALVVGGAWAYLVIYQAQDGDPALFWRVSAAGSGVVFSLLMLVASVAWLGARRAGHPRRGKLAWLAVGLIFLDLASVGAYTDLGNEPPTAGFDHPEIVDFLKGDPGLYRIDSRTDVWGAWQPDLALLTGLYDVSGVDNPLVIADAARFWEGTGGRSTKLYDLLGVRYVLGSKEVTLDWDKFTPAFEADPAVNVYRNETALPRAFVVHRAVVAADHEDAWERIQDAGFDPATTVVLEGGQSLDLLPAEQAQVQVVRYDSSAVELAVDSPAEGYVFLSDPYYPGWQARVDGEPMPILRANYAFRAVAVPAGKHRVTMVYQPTSWYAGLAISLVAGLFLLFLAAFATLRRLRTSHRTVGGT